jgi:hypothetical protein
LKTGKKFNLVSKWFDHSNFEQSVQTALCALTTDPEFEWPFEFRTVKRNAKKRLENMGLSMESGSCISVFKSSGIQMP